MNADDAIKEIQAHQKGERSKEAAYETTRRVQRLRDEILQLQAELAKEEAWLVRQWENATPYVYRGSLTEGI